MHIANASPKILYNGNVVIKIKNKFGTIKTIRVHNNGTPWLWKVLVSALLGNSIAGRTPKSLMAFDDNNNPVLQSAVLLSSSPRSTSGIYSAVFTCGIPARLITGNIYSLSMYSTASVNNDYKLAGVDLTTPILTSDLQDGQSIFIEWRMSFANPYPQYYLITPYITNGTSTGANRLIEGGTATVIISPSTSYDLPSSVTVSNASSSYDSSTGVVTISAPVGNVSITAECPLHVE